MLVRVEIVILPDGTWRVVEIRPLQGWGLGCLVFSGVVVSVDGDAIQLANWPLLMLDGEVEISGEIEPGSVVIFQICFTDDMTLSVVYIIVVYTPPPVVVPPPWPPPWIPPGEGGKVTICHNASGNNPHTIEVSRSALQSHLNHGDTLGPCPSE